MFFFTILMGYREQIDFPSLAEGVAVPHTHYDIERNEAYVNIGTSRDTREFSCDSIRHWWYEYGIPLSIGYPPYYSRIIRYDFYQPSIYERVNRKYKNKSRIKSFFQKLPKLFYARS